MSTRFIQDGDQVWRNEAGRRHREDGPAVIRASGTKIWYRNGQIHREDGPAVIWADGSLAWYLDNKHHRLDGPARVLPDGRFWWWINDRDVTNEVHAWIKENEFPDYTLWTDSQKMMFKLAFAGL